MKRLIIADVKSKNINGESPGHYFAVAQNYVDLYSDYCKVEIAGGPIFKTHFNEKDMFVLPYDFTPNENWVKSKWRVLKNCKYLFENALPDDIIVIQQSGLSAAIMSVALFAKKKSNIYVIAYDTDAVVSPIKRLIYHLARHKIKGLLCSREHIAKAYGIPSCIVTDYIYTKKVTTPAVAFENKKYDIVIAGRIRPGKGVVEAAQYLSKTSLKVLIAGSGNEQMIKQLYVICKQCTNIELCIEYLSEEKYNEYIRSARFCLLNYDDTYEDRSSGVVLDAIFNGTPILGRRYNALTFVEKENLGYLFDNIKELNASIINDPKLYESFLRGINNYIDKQNLYKKSIIEFLGLCK